MPVKVNQITISDDAIFNEMQYHSANSVEEAQRDATCALVIRELLLQEAVINKFLPKNNNDDVEKIEQAIDSLLKEKILIPDADEKTCLKYYQNNLQRFQKKGKPLKFEVVQQRIQRYLYVQSFQNAVAEYIKFLIATNSIVGFDMDNITP